MEKIANISFLLIVCFFLICYSNSAPTGDKGVEQEVIENSEIDKTDAASGVMVYSNEKRVSN